MRRVLFQRHVFAAVHQALHRNLPQPHVVGSQRARLVAEHILNLAEVLHQVGVPAARGLAALGVDHERVAVDEDKALPELDDLHRHKQADGDHVGLQDPKRKKVDADVDRRAAVVALHKDIECHVVAQLPIDVLPEVGQDGKEDTQKYLEAAHQRDLQVEEGVVGTVLEGHLAVVHLDARLLARVHHQPVDSAAVLDQGAAQQDFVHRDGEHARCAVVLPVEAPLEVVQVGVGALALQGALDVHQAAGPQVLHHLDELAQLQRPADLEV
mmetsp:Transcript_29306/g.73620  ORF Transcript_29306/g.73620 Transcript_29306/m.73620 type:complete len:269 (+) Transcript_29306:2490-3296(+)